MTDGRAASRPFSANTAPGKLLSSPQATSIGGREQTLGHGMGHTISKTPTVQSSGSTYTGCSHMRITSTIICCSAMMANTVADTSVLLWRMQI